MKKIYQLPLVLLAATACTSKPKAPSKDDPLAFTYEPELGVVIAKSEFMGKQYSTDTDGSVSDCPNSVGVGITVESSTKDASYIFDKDQQPCQAASVVFDGNLDKFARSANPSIEIVFNDKYGKLAPNHLIEKTADTSTVLTDSSVHYSANADLADKQYNQMGKLTVDYTALKAEPKDNAQQEVFTQNAKQNILKQEEMVMARARALVREEIKEYEASQERKNTHLKADNVLVLQEKEHVTEQLISKTQELTELQVELATLKNMKEVQQVSYEEKVAMLEQRVEEFAQLSLELKRQNQMLAQTAGQSSKMLATDLVEAENNAENARYIAMMKLAKNIEVDEKLARALETSQKNALNRKAQRLQTQADTLSYHARADKVFNKDLDKVYQELQNNTQPAFEGRIARVVGVDINHEAKLRDVQLLLAEKDSSVNEILLEVMADVQPVLGTWKLDWKLASQNLQIKDEKWNVSAETTLYEFFDYIKSRVKEIHGVDLKIEEYPEVRKIVITDNF